MSNNNGIEMATVGIHKSSGDRSQKARSASVDHSNGTIKPILRQTHTHSSLRNTHGITPIIEIIDEENVKQTQKMLTLSVPNLSRKTSTTSLNINKNSVRGSSRSQTSTNGQNTTLVAENNFEGDAMSYRSKYSSNQSLSTIKEQYCCTPQCSFTPRERKLCAAVGVLATIIVILVIAVGVLAGQKGGEHTFRWSL